MWDTCILKYACAENRMLAILCLCCKEFQNLTDTSTKEINAIHATPVKSRYNEEFFNQ